MMLKNKKIVIVGATSGIGEALVSSCLKEGANCILTSTSKDYFKKGSNYHTLDVTDIENIAEFVNKLPKIDGLVYLPGVVKLFPTAFLDVNELNKVRAINFDGAVNLVQQLLRKKKINLSASLVFMSSISSHFPYKGGAAYTSSKAALETYSKTLALELSNKKIRSNCVKAGLVKTKILEQTEQDMPKEIYEEHTQKYPLGIGEPEDVANAILFLLSDNSKWITGTELILDGGLTAGA